MATGRNNEYTRQYNLPGLLFIEPKLPRSSTPVIDDATQKMEAALQRATLGRNGWRGFHVCRCGATSDNQDHIVDGRFVTSSLAVHYVKYHRDEVPVEALLDVLSL